MDGSAVYVKTPRGMDEIEKRTYGLPLRTRQVLIMADGKRNHTDLSDAIGGADFDSILAQLLKDGFLALIASAAAPVAQPKPAAALAASSSADVAIPLDPQERLQMAQKFMINTTESFAGVFGSGLIKQVQKASSLAELHELFQHWEDAVSSGASKKQTVELKTRLIALL